MSDKLQLHEIAGYLPYGLHIKHDEGARLIICGVFKKHNRDDWFTYSLLNWDKDVKSFEAKPILRPMSELTRPMLEEAGFECHIDYLTYELKGLIQRNGIDQVVNMLPYGHCVWLYKNHFDIHNLIGRGLAIDINSLKD